MTHVELQHITIGYGHRVLLEDVSAAIGGGRLVALLGRNGTGKSTLLRAVAGLEAPLSGGIRLCGRLLSATPAHELAQVVSFVTTEKVRIANLASRDVVGLGRAPYTDWLGRLRPGDRAVVDRALNLVGMGGFADKPMDRLSDGEAQRVMIARALAQDTPMILLDEPTAFLDMPNRYELCTLLRRLAHDEGKCIFFSTHELDIALTLCDAMGLAVDVIAVAVPCLVTALACALMTMGVWPLAVTLALLVAGGGATIYFKLPAYTQMEALVRALLTDGSLDGCLNAIAGVLGVLFG